MQSPFKSLADVRINNIRRGFHWFDAGTIRFWKTKLESELINGRYFISSEDEFALDGRKPKRIFAVRYANNDGTITTLAKFLPSLSEAQDFIDSQIKPPEESHS